MLYFFDISEPAGDGSDSVGTNFANFDEMRGEARRALARIAEEHSAQVGKLRLSLRVRDESNVEIYSLQLSFDEQHLH